MRRTDGTLQSDGSYAGGKSTTFGYDALDRQQSMVVDPVVGGNRTTTFDYYASGERMRVVDPSGVAHVDYVDAVGQVTQKRRVKASGVDSSQAYAYDADGNRTRDEKGTEAYNSRDQLVSWTRTNGSSVSYVLNGAGAVLRSTDSAGSDVVNTVDGDRLERSVSTPTQGSAVARTFGYDGFGNLIRIHRVGDQASLDTTYVFDAFERLITSTDPTQTPASTSYGYDGLDRRDFQTIGGQASAFGYIAATDDLSVERASDHSTSFDYGAGGERVGMQVDVGGVGSYRPYITDAQGSVQALETVTGAPEPGSEVKYSPYGEQDAAPSSTMGKQNPYRFQGFYYDPTARAYDALAREYRPDIQRFLTQDRFEAAGGDLALARGSLTSDRYAFVAGNPTTMVEDDGHVSEQQREDAKRAAHLLYQRGTVAYEHMLGYYLGDPAEANRALGVDSWVRAKDAESARYLAWHADRQRRHTREAELRALPHPSLGQRIKGSAEIYGPFLPSGWVGSIARKVAGPVIEKVGPSLQRWGRNVLERLGILQRTPTVVRLAPTEVRLSQSSVNDVEAIAQSMRANGWQGAPIDVVRMPDGALTAIDNTRVIAAHQAGIEVRATVRGFDEALPAGQVGRFTTRRGGRPATWGDAIRNRIGAQSSGYRNRYPNGSSQTGWDGS